MGKQGPCCHCGISTTPLWRNGPPDKPVLCNACGSRWRTKGTLVNYMPMHSGGCGIKCGSELKLNRAKKGSQKIREQHSHKRKEPCDGYSEFDYRYQQTSDYCLNKVFEEDVSTRSSTGSGISYSECCIQHTMGSGRPSDQWPPWECPVPSKRRSLMYRHRPSGNRFFQVHSDLRASNSAVYPEEDLLVEYKPSLMTVEIGLGGVFIRPPMSRVQEQESQASSLMFDSKEFDHSVALKSDITTEKSPALQFCDGGVKATMVRGKEKTRQILRNFDAGRLHPVKSMMPNKALLENFPYNKRDVLQNCQSPLVFVELKDIVNIETFMGLLTDQEQIHLMKQVSSADVSGFPDSLRSMFNSAQFESALRNFQLLLSEGMFDSLESGLSPRVLQHYQQLLTLTDLTTSGWMERCSQIFNRSKRKNALDDGKIMQGKEYQKERLKGSNTFAALIPSVSIGVTETKNPPARSLGSFFTEAEDTRSVPAVASTSYSVHTSISSPSILSDATFGKDLQLAELTSKDQGSSSKDPGFEEGRSRPCFRANNFYPANHGMSSSNRYNSMESLLDEVVEPDILLHLPSNMSFHQAELLQQPEWSKPPPAESGNELKQNRSGDLIANNTWCSEELLDWSGLLWNPPSTGSVHILPNGTA